MIVIVDYGMGNLGSVRNMFGRIGVQTRVASTPEELQGAEKLVLPGVGAFDHAITNLRQRNLVDSLHELVLERHVPVLGICLGMQLMSDGSEEGELPGLGWIPGWTRRFQFPEGLGQRLPHMGWNTLVRMRESSLLADPDPLERFYFVHSYAVQCEDPSHVLAQSHYGVSFTAAIGRGHIQGTQFHPEKSHRFGMDLLRRFAMGIHASA